MTTATFTRLKREPGQPWGVRIPTGYSGSTGDTVVVGKRSGEDTKVELGPVAVQFDDATLFHIAATEKAPSNGNGNGKPDVDETGVYETDDGTMYVVAPSRSNPDHLIAKRVDVLRDGQGDRVNADGEAIRFRFDYERGAVYRLKPEHKMPLEKAKRISQQIRSCICCGQKLEVKESIELGIGPVCRKKYFHTERSSA